MRWRFYVRDESTELNENDHSESALPVVENVSLTEFLRSNGSALAEAVRRLADDAEAHGQHYAAFGNAL